MIKIKNKKASGHIEIILSFVIFTSFVIFLFTTFPVYQTKKSEIGLDSAERGILNFTSAKVSSFSLVFTDNRDQSCFFYPSKDALSEVIVKNSTGDRVNAETSGINWYVYDANWKPGLNDKFYEIYYSSEFSEAGYEIPASLKNNECKDLKTGGGNWGYSIGILRQDYKMSYNMTVSLISLYNSSYDSVKGNFSIPKGENFEFSIVDLKGKTLLNASRNKPERTAVLSRNTPIQMVYKNGTYVFGMLNVKIW